MTSHEVNAGNIGVNAEPPQNVSVPVVEESYESEPTPYGGPTPAVISYLGLAGIFVGLLSLVGIIVVCVGIVLDYVVASLF